MADRREARDVLAHREHAHDAVIGVLRWIEERLHVLGDVHDATAVDAGDERDTPRAQDVDERGIPAFGPNGTLAPLTGPLPLSDLASVAN